jgi:hypothetical protein
MPPTSPKRKNCSLECAKRFTSSFGIGLTTVRIDTDAVNYRFLPIQLKYRKIKRSDIEKMDVITYDPMEDYGGWGIRFSGKGKAYTAKGNHGLYIQLFTGKNILIGTSKPQEMQRFLSKG